MLITLGLTVFLDLVTAVAIWVDRRRDDQRAGLGTPGAGQRGLRAPAGPEFLPRSVGGARCKKLSLPVSAWWRSGAFFRLPPSNKLISTISEDIRGS